MQDREAVIFGICEDADVSYEVAECFAEDAGMVANEGFVTTYCVPGCDLLECKRHSAGFLSHRDYLSYGVK